MRKNLLMILLFVFLAACSGNAPAATITPTATPIPTHTPTPTNTTTPTEAKHPEINPATSATLWPADVQARFKDVLTDPWTATAAEITAFDTYLTTQWQLTLKAEGVANAETLQGYDLLNAIVEHQAPIVLTGNETSEQLASYVVELPFSLHKLLRTDQNNLVGYHFEKGRYIPGQLDVQLKRKVPAEFQGPLMKSDIDWGYATANYGLGGTSSHPDHAKLVIHANNWSEPGSYGFYFYGEKISAATDIVSIDGDAMFLFRIPGTDPNTAVGVMVRMYDGSQIHYAEAFVPFSTVMTTQTDTCTTTSVGLMTTIPCQEGLLLRATNMLDPLGGQGGPATLNVLLKLMRLYKSPHLSLHTLANNVSINWAWKDGIPIVDEIFTQNLPKGFFSK